MGAEVVISGKVDDVCRDSHDECGRETTPEGRKSFIAGNFTQAIEGGSEGLPASFVNSAIRRGGMSGVGGTVEGGVGKHREWCGRCRCGDTELGVIVNPKHFAAAGGNTQVWREFCEGRGRLRETKGREGGRGLRLEADSDDIERSNYYLILSA